MSAITTARRRCLSIVLSFLFYHSNALLIPPSVRIPGVRQSQPSPRRKFGTFHVKVDHAKDDEKHSVVKRFFKSLSNGIFFAFPMRPSLTQALFGIKGKRKNEQKNPASPAATVSFSLRECFLSIGLYLLLGICAYSILMEHWSFVDAVYFSICTFTTVGYGDEVPHTHVSKIFTCLFSLGGIAFLGAALASIGAGLVEAEVNVVSSAKQAGRRRIMALYDAMPRILKNKSRVAMNVTTTAVVPFNATSTKTGDAVPPSAQAKTLMATVRSVVWKLIPSLILLLIGGIAIGRLEGWNYLDSMYYAIITAGTVGLGDFSPQKQTTRLWAIFFIPFAVAAGGEILGTVASAFLERRRIQVYNDLVGKDLTMDHLKEMDLNGDGQVSRFEYLEFMLVEMKLVEPSVLADLNEQFDRLDLTMTDSLTKDDLIAMAKLRRSQQKQTSTNESSTNS